MPLDYETYEVDYCCNCLLFEGYAHKGMSYRQVICRRMKAQKIIPLRLGQRFPDLCPMPIFITKKDIPGQ